MILCRKTFNDKNLINNNSGDNDDPDDDSNYVLWKVGNSDESENSGKKIYNTVTKKNYKQKIFEVSMMTNERLPLLW